MIEENIAKKIQDAEGLLTDEGAAYMVANDLGIDLSNERGMKTRMTISDLMVGASDATITGTVLAVYPVRSFHRKNGREGKVARVIVGDETGIINVVLWDDKAEIAERRLSPEAVIRVNHGYVKVGLEGEPELNVGRRGSVVIIPPNLSRDVGVIVKETYKKIRDINTNDNYVSVVGRVETISAISSFQRKNGDEGQVARVRLADDSGRIVIVFWDEQTRLIQRLHSNDSMKIVNGRVREDASKALEIHVGKESKGVLLDQKPTDVVQPTSVFSKIAALHPGMVNIDVLARVSSIGTIHEFDRSSGDRGRVGEIFLMDETGSIRLSLWDEKTEELKKLTHNDIVLVEGAYARERFGGVSLNLDKMGVLLINPILEEAESLPLHSATFTTINQLRIGLTVSVKGVIPTLPDVKTVVTRDGRELKVASIRIRDETGEVRASFWRSLAEKFDDALAGSQIIVRNAYVKPGYIDELELTSGSITDVEIEHPSTEKTNETPNVLKFHLP